MDRTFLKSQLLIWLTLLLLLVGHRAVLASDASSESYRFVTDRRLSSDKCYPPKQKIFGPFRNSGTLSAGLITVKHSKDGKASVLPDFESVDSAEKMISDVKTACAAAEKAGKQPCIIVYVHGFNATFSQGVKAIDSLNRYYSNNLKDSGDKAGKVALIPILYSWPSMGSKYAYMQDECSLEWSFPKFKKFVDDLSAVTDTSNIHLVAHSLGNKLLFLYLSQKSKNPPVLGTAVMASPDIDFGTAEEYKLEISARVQHLFVLLSNKDKPLIGSRSLHGYSRLGRPSLGPIRSLWLDQFRTGSIPNIVSTTIYLPLLLIERCGYREQEWIKIHKAGAPDWIQNATLIDFTNIDKRWKGHSLCWRLIVPLVLSGKIPFDEEHTDPTCNSPDYYRMCSLFPPRICDPLHSFETTQPYKIIHLKKTCR